LDLTFPTLPSTISKVEEFISSSQTDPEPLIEIVEQDPSVSVNVLRRVNSAYYGVRREIESVDQAVRLLGFVEVSSIVLIQGVNEFQEHFSSHSSLLRRIAHTAVFTGRFGQKFSTALDMPHEWRRRAFLTGFVCAMSRLILLHVAPDRYETLVETSDMPLPPAEDEKDAFGASYRTLAPTAAAHWELPERICATLREAAHPTEEADGPKQILAVSIRTGSFLGRRDLDDEPLIPENGLDQIQTSALEELVTEVARDASTYAAEVGHL
jgi:HD-like signal output (HDOD) protein